MQEKILGFIGMVIVGVLIALTIRGLIAFCYDYGKTARWCKNRKPDTVSDAAVRSIIKDIRDNPHNWITGHSQNVHYANRDEYIRRKDQAIKIDGFSSPDYYASVELPSIGTYHSGNIKPEVIQELTETCRDFKNYVATMVILKPSQVTITEQ